MLHEKNIKLGPDYGIREWELETEDIVHMRENSAATFLTVIGLVLASLSEHHPENLNFFFISHNVGTGGNMQKKVFL